jgi:cellulose biosynthesis protein BcsQ
MLVGKGGVLKTTLTANVVGLTATSRYRVLVVDLDPQGNLAEDLGYTDDSRDGKGRSLAQALMFRGGAAPVLGVRTGLDVLVGGSVLDQATAGLSSRANKDPDGAKLALAQLLAP